MDVVITIRNSILPLAILVYYTHWTLLFRSSCVNGDDATTNWTKMSEGNVCKVCECIDTVNTCMNSWKELFDIYIFSMWIFSLFWSLNWSQACFQSDTIVASRRWTPYCLCWLLVIQEKDHHERIKTQTGDSCLVESRDTKTIYINLIWTIYI